MFADFHKLESRNPADGADLSLVAENDDDDDANLLKYPYERLTLTSDEPVSDIDLTKREVILFTQALRIAHIQSSFRKRSMITLFLPS